MRPLLRAATIAQLLFVVLAVGCHGCGAMVPPSDASVERVYSVVWEGIYDMPKEQRPPIVWHTVASCTDAYGNPGIHHSTSGRCLQGWAGQDAIHVFYAGEVGRTMVAHELYHVAYHLKQPAWLQSVRGYDDDHTDPGWHDLVPTAENALLAGAAADLGDSD